MILHLYHIWLTPSFLILVWLCVTELRRSRNKGHTS